MKKFKNHQRPRRKYRFDIVGLKKALKIWWYSLFKTRNCGYKEATAIVDGMLLGCQDTLAPETILKHAVRFHKIRWFESCWLFETTIMSQEIKKKSFWTDGRLGVFAESVCF
jgi:hypothetical protein